MLTGRSHGIVFVNKLGQEVQGDCRSSHFKSKKAIL